MSGLQAASSIAPDNTTTNISDDATQNFSGDTTTVFYGRLGYGRYELYTEFWIGYYIWTYYLRVLLAVGGPANICAIFTAIRLKPMTSSSLYIVVLAAVDGSALILKLSYVEFNAVELVSDWVCRLMVFSATTTSIYANFILVAMTVERFIAIRFPFKALQYCTVKKASIALAISGFVYMAICSHFLLSYEVDSNGKCKVQPGKWEFDYFYNQVWEWIDAATFSLIPTILLFVFNGMIILVIRRSHALHIQMVNRTDQVQEQGKQQRQVTTMLLTISTMFIILTLPYSCYFLLTSSQNETDETEQHIVSTFMAQQIIFLLADSTHAVNFFMYCMSGRKFRKAFIDAIRCRPQHQNKYTSTGTRSG